MSSALTLAVSAWEYLDIEAPPPVELAEDPLPSTLPVEPVRPGIPEEEVVARMQQAVEQARAAWEIQAHRHQQEGEAKLLQALSSFGQQRAAYFRHLEREVVELAMAIARKVLQREAALDPTLLYGLVRIALDRMGAEPPVRLRVSASGLAAWQQACANHPSLPPCEVVGEAQLHAGDCVVETSLGTANFSLDAQLKELEGALHDVLVRRPETP